MGAADDVILNIIGDFEEFMSKLESRREELEKLKDELMIFNDPEFMESIERGLEEVKKGETVRCDSEDEMDRLFKSL
jgi:predicted translin family RNA/ssDNA-binding protein